MKFKSSNYQLDLEEAIPDRLYRLKLYNDFSEILTIKLDKEYTQSLYGFLFQLYANCESFEINLPPSNMMEKISLKGYFHKMVCAIILEFSRENIFGQRVEYIINIDLEEDNGEFIDLLDLFDLGSLIDQYYDEDTGEVESLSMTDLYYNRVCQ